MIFFFNKVDALIFWSKFDPQTFFASIARNEAATVIEVRDGQQTVVFAATAVFKRLVASQTRHFFRRHDR